jgi:PAS domain S-box-containing protein
MSATGESLIEKARDLARQNAQLLLEARRLRDQSRVAVADLGRMYGRWPLLRLTRLRGASDAPWPGRLPGQLLRILVVEDVEDDVLLLTRELRRAGFEPWIERVDTPEAMAAALDRSTWDLVIADYALPKFSGPGALALLKNRGLDLPFIIVSGAIGEDTAVAAMKAGAHDYIMKGNLMRLVPAIQRELREAEERRRRSAAEAALARERDYSHLLVEGANAMIVGLDCKARVTLFNRAAETTTGYARQDVLGTRWFETIAPRDRFPRAWEWFQAASSGDSPADTESPVITADGEERLITWRNTILRMGSTFVGTIGFGIDVTERKRAEERRAVLEQLARRSEKLAALGTLAAGLAHELNNPIGIISSRIELMLLDAEDSPALPAHVRDDLEVLHRQSQRVIGICRGLLSFARQSSGERVPVDLNQVVEEVLLLAGRQITAAGITVRTRLEPALPALLGDAGTLQQVALNLITNAWDALEPGGEIRVETRRSSSASMAVELVVEDNGRGIRQADLDRVFDPFFSTKPNGTGLGLSITHGIVRDHGGTIDVASQVGKGTRFVVGFPALVGAPVGRRSPARAERAG